VRSDITPDDVLSENGETSGKENMPQKQRRYILDDQQNHPNMPEQIRH
jgi:hypothetical protein